MPELRSNAKATEQTEGMDAGQAAVLQAITSLKTELLAKMDEKAETQNTELRRQVGALRDEMKAAIEHANNRANALEARTASLEETANSHSNTITKLEQQMSQLKKEVVSLTTKAEDLAARSRRCNLRIFGVKEQHEEGTRPSTFVAELLQKVLKLAASQTLISEQGDKIRVSPDYTQSVARQRAAFDG